MIEPDHSRLSIVRQCQLVSIARSSHYYAGKGESPLNLALMRLIDEQYLRTPWYGSRQMARHLRRQGYRVGRKRIRRLMRQMGLMAIYRKPRTSNPNPAHRDLSLPATRPADRSAEPRLVCRRHLYPDASWFPVPGSDHGLGDAYGALLAPVEHPGQRLLCRGPAGPEVFNTDQGCQFTSEDFTSVLKQAGVQISMDGKGRWMDNVFIERLWRSLKYECVYLHAFQDGLRARQAIDTWVRYYNEERPHSTFAGDRTPMEEYSRLRRAA